MLKNVALRTHTHKNLTIEGYSRAAVQTYWRIPELKLGFDLGAQPWSFMGTPTWFVSHAHLDHIAALPVYVTRRRLMKMEPPVIYLPESAIEPVERILRAFRRLDRGGVPCELLPIAPNQEVELSREHVVTTFQTAHTVPSMGFVVWDRRRKLKQEYLGLPGHEIRDLRMAGEDITTETRVPLVAYTGDTSAAGLEQEPAIYEAMILITEMTFVTPGHRPEHLQKHGHLHLDDFVERRHRFKNELIIASHFSSRYHQKQVREQVEKQLPDMLDQRLKLWF
ncbi:MBL fold metallo-hydrolase [Planctomycetales bacterium 10988]|nr:MBL fold metallo-hydrolase [Planctomycetales bacterium 10988]